MAKLTPAQLRALAQIRFAGLVVHSYRDEPVDLAMLDLAPATPIQINRHTVKRLIREGMIERNLDSEYEVDWRISPAGHAALREHPELIAAAGRQINSIQARVAVSLALRDSGDV